MTAQKEKIQKKRRLRYGAFAVTLTVVAVAVVIIINAVFSALAYHFLWYVDMTEEQQYGLTDASRVLLDEYNNVEDLKIEIIFCRPEDEVNSETESKLILNCARRFELEYDFITVRFIDSLVNKAEVESYYTTSASTPKTTNVIITNGSSSRIFYDTGFYTFDSDSGDVFAFNGEYKITAAILQLQGDNPIAYFTSGHGEHTAGSTMMQLFEDAGFDTRIIDLASENIDQNAKVVVINNPMYDFMGADATVNEIDKIDKFLDNFGALMVFMGADTGELPELELFLKEWGIVFGDSLLVDYGNSLSVDGTELVAEYTTDGVGASLQSALRGLDNPPKVIVNYARPIEIVDMYESSRDASAVFTTSSGKTAMAVPFDSLEGASGEYGVYNLMTITVQTRYISNEAHYSYVLAAGSTSFADDKYLGSAAYGNRDVIFNAMKNFGKKTVPLDIDFKVFEDESLDITTAQANSWSVICTAFLPCVVLIVAVTVFVRRKHL